MENYLKLWIFNVVLARPTDQTTTDESSNEEGNGDQIEEDSSPSSSENDDCVKQSKARQKSKPSTREETSKSDNSYSSYLPNDQHRISKNYSIAGPQHKLQSLLNSTDLPSNITTLNEPLSSMSIDRIPSERNSAQKEQRQSALRGERQNTATRGIESWGTLSADDLTLDARACALPRRKPKGAKTKAEKLGNSEDTKSDIKDDKQSKYVHEKDQDSESLNEFIKDLVRKRISPKANVKFYDAAILYEKEDYEGALHFKEETMMIVKSEIKEEVRIELFDSEEFAQSKVCVVEDVLNKCSLVFVYLTANFKSPELKFFIEEAIAMSRLGLGNQDVYTALANTDRRWVLKPIHTQPPKFRAYSVPVGLLSLNGIEWYNKDSAHTRNQIRAIMHKALDTRKQRELHTSTIHQYSQMIGPPAGKHRQETYSRGNLQPNKQQFPSHQSHDAMSLAWEAGQYHHNQQDQLISGRYVFPPTGALPRYPANSNDQTNSQGHLNSYLQQGFTSDLHSGQIYLDQQSSLPNTIYGSMSNSSQQHMPSAAHQQSYPQPRNGHQLIGMQNKILQPGNSNSFQGCSNQSSTQLYQAPYIRQSAGLQSTQQPDIRENFQRFSNQPRSSFYQENVPTQSNRIYTNQANTAMQPIQPGGVPGYWNHQNSAETPQISRLNGYPGQHNLSPVYGGQPVDMQGSPCNAHTNVQNVNVQQSGIYSHNQDQQMSRDALHSLPGSYYPDPSSQISAVSKVTGKLIINPNLSTDDVEIDNHVTTQNFEAKPKSHRRRVKCDKKGRRRVKYDSEYPSSDSDCDFQISKFSKGKEVVNIVGCKVVQLGTRNKVREKESKYDDVMIESQTAKSKCEGRNKKEKVEDNKKLSPSLSSFNHIVTKQNRRQISASESTELSADNLSIGRSLQQNVNNSSEEKHFLERKNISESLFYHSTEENVGRNIPTEVNQLNHFGTRQIDTSRNDRDISFENDRRCLTTDDNDLNEDYLFESSIYSTGTPKCDKENIAPFSFSRKSKSSFMDVFAGRNSHLIESNQYSKQEDEESELD